MVFIMITKNQVIINREQQRFKYLERRENQKKNRVDVHELSQRLNKNKILNYYSNTKVIALCFSCIIIIMLISFKF